MSLQVLIATMYQPYDDYSLLEKVGIQSSAVVINQCERDLIRSISYRNNDVLWIDTTERGLSNSRNMAILNATADICLIADDDEELESNYVETVEKAFRRNKKYSIIRFQIEGIEKCFKRYPLNKQKIGYLSSLKVSSVEIAFRRKDILDNNIKFDPLLGSGAEFNHGEENAFIFECLRKKLNVIYIPAVISKLHFGDSTWFDGYNEKYFIGSGAAYTSMSPRFAWFFIMVFALRHYDLYKDEMTVLRALRAMFRGRKAYLSKYSFSKKNTEFSKKIYVVGDFFSNNGPANANRTILNAVRKIGQVNFSKERGKVKRVTETVIQIIWCNICIICSASKLNFLILKLTRLLAKPVILIMHGCGTKEYIINGGNITDKQYQRLVEYEKIMFSKAQKVVCVSEMFCNDMKERYPEYKNKIEFINNVVNVTHIKEAKKNKNLIVSTGGGMRRKRNLNIAKAIEIIREKSGRNIEYFVIGEELNDGAEIKSFDFVTYYDYLPHEEVLRVFHEASLYIQNSEYETFGLAVMEAFESGASLLLSRHVGCKSLFPTILPEDVIDDVDDLSEIAGKIEYLFEHPNFERLWSQFDSYYISEEFVSSKINRIVRELE